MQWLKNNTPPASLWGFGVFFVAAGVFGETWPLSRLPMYSSSGLRTEGAMPAFEVDGKPAEVRDFEAFQGAPLEDLLPDRRCRECPQITGERCRNFASSFGFVTQADLEWMRGHEAVEPDAAARTAIYGYRLIRVEGGEVLIGDLVPAWCGTARPR